MPAHVLSHENCPCLGRSETPSNTWFLGPIQILNPNGTSIISAVFAQLTEERPHTLQWATLSPSKLPLPMGGMLITI